MKLHLSIFKPLSLVATTVFIVCCPTVHGQAFSSTPPNGGMTSVTACGIPGVPGGCIQDYVQLGGPDRQLSMSFIIAGELADVRQELVALQTEINSLKQSTQDAANATKQAAKDIEDQNVKFDKEFSVTILQKLENYPADFVKSAAYNQLKTDLMKYIDQKLAAQHGQTAQPSTNPSQGTNAPAPLSQAPASSEPPSAGSGQSGLTARPTPVKDGAVASSSRQGP